MIVGGEKITERVRLSAHPAIHERLRRLKDIDYELFVHSDAFFDETEPVFTIALTFHGSNNEYLARSIRSIAEQTYDNVELILISNGASGDAEDSAWNAFLANHRAKYIRVPENLYNPGASDFADPIANLWNAGLFASVGDFVYFLSYDDFVSADYAARLVSLFQENPACCTAAPLVASVNERHEVNQAASENLRLRNRRPRFTNGIELAKSYMRDGDLIRFPGGVMAVKSELALQTGGFDNLSDLSQLFKFAIHGESGFDPEARLYWRHHAEQTNVHQIKLGMIYYRNLITYSTRHDIYRMHREVAGEEFADEFDAYLKTKATTDAVASFGYSVSEGPRPALRALRRLLVECPPGVIGNAIWQVLAGVPRIAYTYYAPRPLQVLYRKMRGVVRRHRTSTHT